MILVDTNVFMYAAGAQHPLKLPSVRFLERVSRGESDVAIDSEILQEILHRYKSLRMWKQACLVYELARKIVPVIIPVTGEIVDHARALIDRYPSLMVRDAIHASVVLTTPLEGVCTFDKNFDDIENLRRIEPTL